MTSTDSTIANVAPATDLHPFWCTLTDRCEDPKNQRHEGGGARWPAQSDDVEFDAR